MSARNFVVNNYCRLGNVTSIPVILDSTARRVLDTRRKNVFFFIYYYSETVTKTLRTTTFVLPYNDTGEILKYNWRHKKKKCENAHGNRFRRAGAVYTGYGTRRCVCALWRLLGAYCDRRPRRRRRQRRKGAKPDGGQWRGRRYCDHASSPS